MNNTFNAQRFGFFFKKTILERPMQLFGLVGLSLAIVFFAYIFCKAIAGFETAQNTSFLLGLIGGGSFLASFVYNYFSSNAMGSSFLTLPVSHFEKWLCGVLLTGVLYVSVFLVFYRIMDAAFVEIYHSSLDPTAVFYKELYDQVQVFPFNGFVAEKASVMFLNFAGAMLLGSLYFNKVSFIKVALLICAFWIGSYLFNLVIAKAMIQNVDNALPYLLVWIGVNKDTGRIELPENVASTVSTLIHYIIPAILWVLAYVRLREKEF